MKKSFILQLLLLFLFALTVTPLFAESIVIDFGDKDENSIYRPYDNGIFRFNDFILLPGGGNQSENQGFRFTYFGILLKEGAADRDLPAIYNQDKDKGYYWGNAPDSNFIGYNDSGRTASIERIDGTPFTFEGGYFTPANYAQGWVNLIGWALDDYYELEKKYDILLDIQFKLQDDGTYEPMYYDLSLEKYGGVFEDIVRLDIKGVDSVTSNVLTYQGVEYEWSGQIKSAWQYQIVMDNLSFRVGNTEAGGTATPEPATIAVLGLGMIGLLASRKKSKKAR